MRTARARLIIDCLRKATAPDAGLTDGQLLGMYVSSRDAGAFEGLVHRHGPMVLAVCRRVLRHAQDADDAFQATFLILARKAASVAKRESVGAWLHGVAYHAAIQARASRLRREAREHQVEDMPHPIVMPEDNHNELLERLDRELARLPEKHRLPLVLCELEGRSRREVARLLGLTEGTLSSRLARGRRMLARRMAGCGAAVAAASLTALFAGGARAACVPGALVTSTVGAAGGSVPAGVAALVKGVMKAMLLTKLKCGTWMLLIAAVVGVGATWWVCRMEAAEKPRPVVEDATPPTAGIPAARPASPDRDELESLRLEMEALRLELKATKQRVKALEDAAHGQRAGPGVGPTPGLPGAVPPATPPGLPGSGFAPPIPGVPGVGDNVPLPTGTSPPGFAPGSPPGFPTAPPPGVEPQPKGPPPVPQVSDLDAALKALKQNPDDKQALDALLRALRRQKDPEPPPAR